MIHGYKYMYVMGLDCVFVFFLYDLAFIYGIPYVLSIYI